MTLKQDTRASVLARRKQIPSALREEKSRLICERFLAEIDNRIAGETPSCASAKQLRIAAYEPMTSEVDVHPHVICGIRTRLGDVPTLHGQGRSRCACAHGVLPYRAEPPGPNSAPPSLDHPARPYLLDDLHAQGWREADEQLFDVAVIPLVAFDSSLMRLGYGGGNYDRFLLKLRDDCFVAGVAFEEQRVDRVPTEPHDLPLPRIFSA